MKVLQKREPHRRDERFFNKNTHHPLQKRLAKARLKEERIKNKE